MKWSHCQGSVLRWQGAKSPFGLLFHFLERYWTARTIERFFTCQTAKPLLQVLIYTQFYRNTKTITIFTVQNVAPLKALSIAEKIIGQVIRKPIEVYYPWSAHHTLFHVKIESPAQMPRFSRQIKIRSARSRAMTLSKSYLC